MSQWYLYRSMSALIRYDIKIILYILASHLLFYLTVWAVDVLTFASCCCKVLWKCAFFIPKFLYWGIEELWRTDKWLRARLWHDANGVPVWRSDELWYWRKWSEPCFMLGSVSKNCVFDFGDSTLEFNRVIVTTLKQTRSDDEETSSFLGFPITRRK